MYLVVKMIIKQIMNGINLDIIVSQWYNNLDISQEKSSM